MQSKQWKKVGMAAVVGVSFGVVAATVSTRHPALREQETSAPYIVPVADTGSNFSASRLQTDSTVDSQTDPIEVERLKTRNRRLEALVTVLRHRFAERQ